MKPCSDSQLEALLNGGESEQVEFKSTWSKDLASKARKAICAFANDLPGHDTPGVLFVGVDDQGKPCGLPVTDELLRDLAEFHSDGKILPKPTLSVEKRWLKGVAVAVVTVQPAISPPVRVDGRIWVRKGPRQAIATPQDEQILNDRRRYRDQPFDARPAQGTSLQDLDLLWYERIYLPAAIAPDILEANDRTIEQRLASTRMVLDPQDPQPTHLGVLALGLRPLDVLPCCYLQFLRVDGTDPADPVLDAEAIDGKLVDVIRRCEEKLAAHNHTAVHFATSEQEQRRSTYPVAALQQLLRNAVMHRSYENASSPISVTWYADRLEILSPGGPVGMVNKETFGKPGYVAYRNPNLAAFLKDTGFVQRFGAGIATARRACEANGSPPPEFEVSDEAIRSTLKLAQPVGFGSAPLITATDVEIPLEPDLSSLQGLGNLDPGLPWPAGTP